MSRYPMHTVLLTLPLLHAASASADAPTLKTVNVQSQATSIKEQLATVGSRLGMTVWETPASVDVISGETLRQRGDATVQEAVSRAAGITNMGGPNNGGVVLTSRGFAGQNSVVQLLDGVRIDTVGLGSISFPFDAWTAERVEVLRGPASVLYGAGAIGGAVNVVSKAPSRDWQHEGLVSYGSYDSRRVALGSGGPLGSSVAYRVDVNRREANNWVDHAKSESTAISAALQFDLTPTLRSTLSRDFGHQEPMPYWGTPLIDGKIDSSLADRNLNIGDAYVRHIDRWTRLNTTWQPTEQFTLRNQTYALAYDRYWHAIETYTWDPASRRVRRTNFTENKHHREQYGTRTDALIKHQLGAFENNLTAGFELSANRYRTSSYPASGAAALIDPYNYQPDYYTAINYASLSGQRSKMDQTALFIEDRIELSPRLSVVGGLRHEELSLDYRNRASNVRNDNSENQTTWRLGSVYALNDALALYAQYATGADPIGTVYTSDSAKFTTGKQAEIGLKHSFLQGRGEWTLAAYRIVKKDLETADPLVPSNTIQVGQQSSKGLEASVSLAITDTLRIDGNVAVLKAEYDDFDQVVSGQLVSRAGNVPTNVPERSANLWVSWDFAPAFNLAAGVRHVGKRYADTANTKTADAFDVVDANLSYNITPNAKTTLRVRNAFDEEYAGGNAAFNNGNQIMLSAPRTVELEVSGKF